MAKKKPPLKDVSSEILFRDLFDENGTIRLNPFKRGKRTYRVIGTERVSDLVYVHTLKCEETGDYVRSNHDKIKLNVMAEKSKPIPLVKVKDFTQVNKTIEQHKKQVDSNQKNIFDELPDVKIKKP